MADWPYNSANWKRLRKAHLAAFPWCEGCKHMGKPHVLANTVDHRVPISEGGPAFAGHDGLASYCPACHNAKTARGSEHGAVRSNKPRRGCNPDGSPLDPAHPWHGGNDDSKNRAKSLTAEPERPPPNPKTQLVQVRNRKGERHGR